MDFKNLPKPMNEVQKWEKHRKECQQCHAADKALGVTALNMEQMRCQDGKQLFAAAISSLFRKRE